MSTVIKTYIGLAIGATVIVLMVLGFLSWRDSHDALIKMQAQLTAKEELLQHYADDRAKSEADAAKQVAQLQNAAAQQKTPEQIVKWIPQQLQAPQPIQVTLASPTPDNPKPNANFSVPQDDLPYLRDSITKCQTCQVNLAAREKEITDADKTIATLKGERDLAVTAAKGGTKWQRFKGALKYIGIGAAGGAVALCATGHCKL